ncbi:electron transport complex subunit RsxC [Clostridium magnum]|uniref:Ion-translocating oxidoreductase complex subunit C n=1 Tax=Clostridium magnum DSM 2767 TaxID=1121326 RepID=A0A162SV54_9CLOT|nr:electron transport complex subunit RsxC [Clostridium magnum]KZL91911.1 electron transport complex subunit RnfC [Clostridium magnum DSM 2767]SHH30135.1 electron transport complex protein RnfC [Clostridium magnum DSM 2767]
MFKSFRGGVHPNDYKSYTANVHIEKVPVSKKVIIPVSQHIGAPGVPIVNIGDRVKKGQLIAKAEAPITSYVHASTSGKVTDIAVYSSSYRDKSLAIVIESDGLDQWMPGLPLNRDWEKMKVEEIQGIIKEAGIVGMGGANFPTHFKLSYGPEKKIDTVILNGSECEPYLTSDYRLMIEETEKVVTGFRIALKCLNVKRGIVGVEDNKPEAIKVLTEAFKGTGVEVVALPTKYPQGAERMLIKVLTGREIPAGKRHSDIGVVGLNVSTIVAVANAVVNGIPAIERVTTVTGDAIKEPKNLLVKIGTSFKDVIDYCGGYSKTPKKIINGGPMMGYAQDSLEIPVVKGVAGILVLSKDAVSHDEKSACIRCGRCVKACPIGLVPSMLSILSERDRHEEARESYGLMNCIECGSCAYVCPSKRNIVQNIRYSKSKNAAHAHK